MRVGGGALITLRGWPGCYGFHGFRGSRRRAFLPGVQSRPALRGFHVDQPTPLRLSRAICSIAAAAVRSIADVFLLLLFHLLGDRDPDLASAGRIIRYSGPSLATRGGREHEGGDRRRFLSGAATAPTRLRLRLAQPGGLQGSNGAAALGRRRRWRGASEDKQSASVPKPHGPSDHIL